MYENLLPRFTVCEKQKHARMQLAQRHHQHKHK